MIWWFLDILNLNSLACPHFFSFHILPTNFHMPKSHIHTYTHKHSPYKRAFPFDSISFRLDHSFANTRVHFDHVYMTKIEPRQTLFTVDFEWLWLVIISMALGMRIDFVCTNFGIVPINFHNFNVFIPSTENKLKFLCNLAWNASSVQYLPFYLKPFLWWFKRFNWKEVRIIYKRLRTFGLMGLPKGILIMNAYFCISNNENSIS